MSVDTLSDVLQGVRLKGAVFFDIETVSPWVAEALPGKVMAPAVMPDAEHVIEYHVVTSGSCWASLIDSDAEPVHLTAGDVVAFPQGDAHVLSSAPGMRGDPDPGMLKLTETATQLPLILNLDGGGQERAHIVCGFLGCDSRPFNPLLELLPRILHVRTSAGARRGWVDQFTRFAVMEAKEKRAGGNGILSKLGEFMFVELVRDYVELLPGREQRLVGRSARPSCRPCSEPAACAAHARLDTRRARQGRWRVTVIACRAVHRARRHSAHALPSEMAAADRGHPAVRGKRQHCSDRSGYRLRVGGRIQPRLQEACRPAARRMAQQESRRGYTLTE